jgi:Holliday junction DNA helicase RuvA
MYFYYLNGTVALLDTNLAVIDCGGVGYACYTTTYTQSQLTVGQNAKLYTYCSIREDAFDIFGFSSKEEKRCFERLLSVSGVGPKAALAILSVSTPQAFTMAILTGDEKALTRAPGIGKKLAQRILLELKDKLSTAEADVAGAGVSMAVATGNAASEAAAALEVLGYSQAEIAAAMRGIDPTLPTDEIVRLALRNTLTQ